MVGQLDITGSDISLLNDNDLRDLIGLLCEADLRKANHNLKGVFWSGHQDAPDGGFDVFLNLDKDPPEESFIPSKMVGVQVKKPNMPASAIKKEMSKNGILKSEIKELVESGGTYILISSNSSTSKAALDNRLTAMKESLAQEGLDSTSVLFYDQGQVATWVRTYKSLVVWVRNKIGRPIKGWQPFSTWSFSKGNVNDEYIIDDSFQLFNGISNTDSSCTINEGILQLRNELSIPRNSVRLVGLSGVGKTRLVEALFDNRISEKSLNPDLVLYTDISDSPYPDPMILCQEIVNDNIEAFVIIDNCTPELHRKLTDIITSDGRASLITIEYDVRDDLPDETSVFRLEPASDITIENFLHRRYEVINRFQARHIANFSGGNFRLAVALSNTFKNSDNIAELSDMELFERLFVQRNQKNDDLLFSAMAMSLVYSFDGTDTAVEVSEISALAALVDRPIPRFYRDIDTLRKRDLIQSRGQWRALLPHAMSNKLASNALDAIPLAKIYDTFLKCDERLLMSFAHRLSFMHTNKTAIEIAEYFLSLDGLFKNLEQNLDYQQLRILEYLAPISPESTLLLIEFWMNSRNDISVLIQNGRYTVRIVRILKNIAYDTIFFERSLTLLIRIALSELPNERIDPTRSILKPFFQVSLSGSHASLSQRLDLVQGLFRSKIQEEQELAVQLCDSLLKSSYFHGNAVDAFGSRKRNQGYNPNTFEDFSKWYVDVLKFLDSYMNQKDSIGEELRKSFGNHLRSLISNIGVTVEIEALILQLSSDFIWQDGWRALKSLVVYDKRNLEKDTLEAVLNLERQLRPSTLEEKIRLYALTESNRVFDIDEEGPQDESTRERLERIGLETINLGRCLSEDRELLEKLFPELVHRRNRYIRFLGKGLFNNILQRRYIWEQLKTNYKDDVEEKKDINLLLGFLDSCALTLPGMHDDLMEELISEKSPLLIWFPILQCTIQINTTRLERVHRSLDLNLSKIENYSDVAYHCNEEEIDDVKLVPLIEKIISKENGAEVALSILDTYSYEKSKFTESIAILSYKALCLYNFEKTVNFLDFYALNKTLELTLNSIDASILADDTFCKNLADYINKDIIQTDNYNNLLITLAKYQPLIFLEIFLSETSQPLGYSIYMLFRDESGRLSNPIDNISTQTLITWAKVNKIDRYVILFKSINLISASHANTDFRWKPIVQFILNDIDIAEEILDNLEYFIHPRSWSGSKVPILKKRIKLLEVLASNPKQVVQDWAKKSIIKLKESMKYWETIDMDRNRRDIESFE